MAEGACARVFDFYEMTIDELKEFTIPLSWVVKRTGVLHGVRGGVSGAFFASTESLDPPSQIASWFDLGFYPPRHVDPLIGDAVNEQLQAEWAAAEQQPAGFAAWMGGYDNGMNPPPLPLAPADGLVVKLDTGPFGACACVAGGRGVWAGWLMM